MAETTEKQKGYALGYAAGRRKGEREGRDAGTKQVQHFRRDEFRLKAYLAIAPAVIASNWDRKKEGEKTTVESKMQCVDSFVTELMKRY